MTGKGTKFAIPSEGVVLRLYVAGSGPNSTEARANLQAFLAMHSNRRVTLEIVDVLTDPDRGLRDAIVVTPTLVRDGPPHERRVIGNLRDRGAVLTSLLGERDDDE